MGYILGGIFGTTRFPVPLATEHKSNLKKLWEDTHNLLHMSPDGAEVTLQQTLSVLAL